MSPYGHVNVRWNSGLTEVRQGQIGRPVPARGGSLGPPPFPSFSQSPTRGPSTLLHTTSVPSQKDAREEAKEDIHSDVEPTALGLRLR